MQKIILFVGGSVGADDADGAAAARVANLLELRTGYAEGVFPTDGLELALRIARECTGGQGIIASAHAYHGNSAAVAQISSVFTPPEKRGPYVRTIPVIDPYRERNGRDDESLSSAYAQDVKQAIDDFTRKGVKFAGLLICTAYSSEGLPTVPAGYLAKVVKIVHDAGGLFIADEVQAGFGRFGSRLRMEKSASLLTT